MELPSDGYHIGLLIMAAIQKLCPQFLQEGRLCWLRTPLYIVSNGKEETYYYTDEVSRAKGIGSLSPQQAHNAMFVEKNQRIDVLQPTDEAIELLNMLMGKDIAPRRDFIFSHVDFSKISE